ncbi:hypothetical protein ABVT39_000438 [Epinephelus coioides]
MSSQGTGCSKADDAPIKFGVRLEHTLKCVISADANPHLAASFGRSPLPLGTTQWCSNIRPGSCPKHCRIVCEALRMNLPQHLVLGLVQRRLQTHAADYTDMKELVADLFAANGRSGSGEDQEVPMETNQLEEALMTNTLGV